MLKTLQNPDEIRNAQETLESVLQAITNARIPVAIGHKGRNVKTVVSYSKKYDMWFYLGDEVGEDYGRRRYWNVFGLNAPKENWNVPIVVEINPPLEGIDRRVAGVFARDDQGNVFLLHRGIIGGGREGIGPSAFHKHYDGEKALLDEDNKEIAVIGCITAADFPGRLRAFVQKVDEIKSLVHPK